MANERCPDCGARYALVGRIHRCVPSSDGAGKEPHQLPSQQGTPTAFSEPVMPLRTERSDAGPSDSTYRYRDADKRREYMREHMRKKRARG